MNLKEIKNLLSAGELQLKKTLQLLTLDESQELLGFVAEKIIASVAEFEGNKTKEGMFITATYLAAGNSLCKYVVDRMENIEKARLN